MTKEPDSGDIEVQLPVKDIQRIVKDAKVQEIVAKCEQTEPGRIGECVEGALLERLTDMFAEEEAITPIPMEQWVKEDPSPESDTCRPCVLPVTIRWYNDELKARGQKALASRLRDIALGSDHLASAKELDNIKDLVDESTRKRLLDFDAATQANA